MRRGSNHGSIRCQGSHYTFMTPVRLANHGNSPCPFLRWARGGKMHSVFDLTRYLSSSPSGPPRAELNEIPVSLVIIFDDLFRQLSARLKYRSTVGFLMPTHFTIRILMRVGCSRRHGRLSQIHFIPLTRRKRTHRAILSCGHSICLH
jgi:hypothetical protein